MDRMDWMGRFKVKSTHNHVLHPTQAQLELFLPWQATPLNIVDTGGGENLTGRTNHCGRIGFFVEKL